MGKVKNYYFEDILKMSHQGNDEFLEATDEANDELDEFQYIGPRIKAVAWRSGYDWHIQVEGYPENHFDSYLSDPGPIPNDKIDLWIKCRPWFDVRKEE